MSGRFDRLVDRAVAVAASVPPMFRDGWGPWGLFQSLLDRASTAPTREPAPIEVTWLTKEAPSNETRRLRGFFHSPDSSLPLPPETRAAYFEMLLPPGTDEGARPPMCLHLAGSGDVTYVGRRLIAGPVAREAGIGAIILQNPYYGERKPHNQVGPKLRRVVDQLMMNLATLAEARSLLKWLRDRGHDRVGVTGYSMGGFLAAMTAQTISFPLASIPCATGTSAVYPLVRSPLQRRIDWGRLADDFPYDTDVREFLADRLERLALDRQGDLTYPEAAILLGARQDLFVPPDLVERLHDHWEGAELRWIDAGHTTGWANHSGRIQSAITDAFDRLDELVAPASAA